jgi:hypothetical protein
MMLANNCTNLETEAVLACGSESQAD